MDLSLGMPPQGGQENSLTGPAPQSPESNVTGNFTTTGPFSTQSTTVQPRVDQPVSDDISKSTATPSQFQINYTAAAQLPILPKPTDPNQPAPFGKPADPNEPATAPAKPPDKEGTGKTVAGKKEATGKETESGVHHTPLGEITIQGEQKTEKQQQQQEGQQGGGSQGEGKGGQGSESGGGSFSGGQNQSQGQPNLTSPSTNPTSSTSETSEIGEINSVSPTTQTEAAFTLNDTTVKPTKINPLDSPTTISTSGLFSPPVNPAQFFDNGGKIMTELYAATAKLLNAMPASPESFRYMDFLKLVQTAISQFQQLLRSIEGDDSKGAQARNKAQLETSLAQIEDQRKKQADMDKKTESAQKKLAIMGPLCIIFAFLLVLVLALVLLLFTLFLLIAGPAGWIVLSMLVCEFIDQGAQMCGKKPFLMQKFMNFIGNTTTAVVVSATQAMNLTPQQLAKTEAIAKTVVTSIALAVAFLTAPALMLVAGSQALISFLTDSNIISDMQQQDGASQEDADKTQAYVTLGITIGFALCQLALVFVMPASTAEGAADMFAQISETASKFAIKAAKALTAAIKYLTDIGDTASAAIVKTLEVTFKTLMDPLVWVSLSSLALQTTEDISTYRYQSLLANIALIQGNLDKDNENFSATIAILKKMIKEMLAGLEDIGKEISFLGQTLQKTNTSVGQISTNLFG